MSFLIINYKSLKFSKRRKRDVMTFKEYNEQVDEGAKFCTVVSKVFSGQAFL